MAWRSSRSRRRRKSGPTFHVLRNLAAIRRCRPPRESWQRPAPGRDERRATGRSRAPLRSPAADRRPAEQHCSARRRRLGADCEEGIDSTLPLQPIAEAFVGDEQTEQQEAATEEKQIQHGILSGTRRIEGPLTV